MTGVPSFRPRRCGRVPPRRTPSCPLTVLRPFDDGYLIRLDPTALTPETLLRVLGEVNAHFVEHDDTLLDYQDARSP